MMKSKFTHLYAAMAVLLICIGNSGNPPDGRTGSSGATCADCHSGGNFGGNIDITGLPNTIMPNTTYTITVTNSFSSGNPVRGGFQMDVNDTGGSDVGTLANPSSSSSISGGIYFEHTPATNYNGNNSVSWTVDWTSPAGPTGETITMYSFGVIANGANGNNGDDTAGTTASGVLAAGGGTVMVAITNTSDASCFNGNDGTATAEASGGSGNYSYAWSSGDMTATATNLVAGTYTVTATDATNGATASAMATIGQPSSAVSAVITATSDIDCNNPLGSATASGSGGVGGYVYSWSDGQSGPTVNLGAGPFSVTVADANNCIAIANGIINADITPPAADAGFSMQIDCINTTAILQGSGSQGAEFSYLWTTTNGNIVNGETTLTPQVDAAGNYLLTVTNNTTGCTNTDNTTVTANTTPPFADAGPDMQLDCNNLTVFLDGGNSTPGMFYQWTTTNGNIVGGGTTTMPSVDAAGTYTLTVTNQTNGCFATSSVVVTEDFVTPTAIIQPPSALDCNTTVVLLDGSASSGTALTYLWTTVNGNIVSGADTATPSVDAAGIYTLTVTNNQNGCTDSDMVSVVQDANVPNADAGISMSLNCVTTSVTLDGSASSQGASFSYLWTTSNGNIVAGATTLTPTVDAAGQYCIEVIDNSNGCVDVSCVTVNADFAIPTAVATVSGEINCVNTCVNLDASGSSQGANISYQWNGPNNFNSTQISPEVCVSGNYTLIVTDNSNGCTASAIVDVTENTVVPSVTISTSGDLNCNNTSVTLTANSSATNSTYSWIGPDNFTSNISDPSVSVAGTYEVTVTDANNGCTTSVVVIVNETAAPTVTITSQTDVTCPGGNDGSATALATGGAGNFTYIWSSGGQTATETGLEAGMYLVVATDADGCTGSAMVTITEPTILLTNATATPVTAAGANDGTATATPSGGTPPYAYLWSNGSMMSTIDNLAPGMYTVTVTDANLCTAEQTVSVSDFDCGNLTVSFDVTNLTCNGDMSGSISAIVDNAATPITYAWDNGMTEQTISNLAAGTYTVTATDANNCEVIGSATVTEPDVISIMTSGTNVNCNGGNDGTATAIVTGGTGIVTFAWDNGMMGQTITNLIAGVYNVVVTDENGCTAMASVTITEPAAIVLNVSTTDETGNGANDGTATANVSGGVGSYSFIWDTNETTQMISNLSPGQYCVTVTDANGCTAESCESVNMFGCDNVTNVFNQTNVSCFGDADGSASVSSSGGAAPYTYAWSNGATTATIANILAGTYSVTCTDATNCSAVGQVIITQPDSLSVAIIDSGDVDCVGNDNGFANAEATGGISDYAYLWSNGEMTSMIANLAPGTYTVTATDQNMCTASSDIIIDELPDTTPPMAIANNIMVSLDANGMAAITANMVDNGSTDNCGLATIGINIDEFNCDDLGEVEVILTATDNAGLSSETTAIITVLDEIPPVLTCPINIIEIGCNNVINYDTPTAADNCSTTDPVLIAGLPSGSNFPAGSTTVEWMVADISGNTSTCSFSITLDANITATTSFTEPACFGFSNGTATVEITGGVPPYMYLWDDALMQVTQTAVNLTTGTYTCTVTDASGCSILATAEVTQPEIIDIDIVEIIPETNNQMDGAITIEVNGGTGNPFNYEWFLNGNSFSTDPNLTNLNGGTYVLFVTDPSNCVNSDTVIVDMITGTDNQGLAEQISILPNPTSGKFQIEMTFAAEAEVNISIFDVAGKEMTNLPTAEVLNQIFEIDLTDFAEGVYLIQMQVGDDLLMKKILIQKE